MTIYHLPQYFFGESQTLPPVLHYDYHSQRATHRSQIDLSYHLVSFLQAGAKVVQVPEASACIGQGQLLLMRSGSCLMSETLSAKAHYHSHLLWFRPEVLQDFLLKHQIHVPDAPDQDRAYKVLAYDAYLQHFVESLALLPPRSSRLLAVKVEELLLYWYQQYGAAFFAFWQAPPSAEHQQLVQVAQQAIETKLTVEQMAFLCHMSTSTFKRKFAVHYQDSPQHWLREQRLQRARWLLEEEHCRPSEVFERVGFEHLSSFSQAFKKRFGLLPSGFGAKMSQ